MFKPVKTKKVYEEIVEQIKQLIVDGKLQPGDKISSERELAETLGVSRASIREAFSALEMMGVTLSVLQLDEQLEMLMRVPCSSIGLKTTGK